jgi:hypothetical protein
MIYFNINIRNPWWGDRWANVYNKSGETPWKHKFWEFEVLKDSELISAEFSLTHRQDHAGIKLGIGLLGYSASFTLYDSRHWNDEEGRWYVYGEEQDWDNE